jgi:hypothetical protein
MDPDQALANCIDLAWKIVKEAEHLADTAPDDRAHMADLGNDLAEQFLALNDWLTQSGFAPRGWTFHNRKNGL